MQESEKLLSNQTGFTADNYSFQILRPQHAQAALEILSEEFQNQQPLSNAFYKFFPHKRGEDHHNWKNLWKLFEKDYVTNGVSVGCFDMNNGGELVGVSVSKDLNYVPEGLVEQFTDNLNFMSAIFKVQEKLKAKVNPKYQEILAQNGVVMDIWGVAIKKEHMGKQILHKMMSLNEKLGAQKYQYFFVYACNFKTGVACTKRGFEKISTLDAREFEINGERIYQHIEQLQSFPTLWLKKIQKKEHP